MSLMLAERLGELSALVNYLICKILHVELLYISS